MTETRIKGTKSMPKWKAVVAVITVLGASQPTTAQTWMADGGKVRISVKYRDNNEVRVDTVGVQRRDPAIQFRIALLAVARATKEKGFSRFGLTKITSCGTVNGYGITPCRLVARMLNAGENVPSQSGDTVKYFDTHDLLGDTIPLAP